MRALLLRELQEEGLWEVPESGTLRGPAPECGETGRPLLSSCKQGDRTLLLLVGLESHELVG